MDGLVHLSSCHVTVLVRTLHGVRLGRGMVLAEFSNNASTSTDLMVRYSLSSNRIKCISAYTHGPFLS